MTITLSPRDGGYAEAEFAVGRDAGGLGLYCDDGFPEGGLIVLFDPHGDIRLNRWARRGETVALGPDPTQTSAGGVPGAIPSGKWSLRAFLPFPSDKDFPIEIRPEATSPTEPLVTPMTTDPGRALRMAGYEPERVYAARPGWFKGDFHTHTILSDGKEPVSGAMRKAERMGLDFYVPTEHNALHTEVPDTRVMVLPGLEVTSADGHFNIFGLDRQPERFFEPQCWERGLIRKDAFPAILADAASAGAICSLNHPFLREWAWNLPDIPLSLFHAVEVMNDPTYTYAADSNEAALALWSAMWNAGHHIFGIGGSDSHNLESDRYDGATEPSVAGDPSTWVYCDRLSPRRLLDAVRAGHICVMRYGIRLEAEITSGGVSYLPGDEIRPRDGEARVSCTVAAGVAREPLLVQWVINGEIMREDRTPHEGGRVCFDYSGPANRHTWIRADIRGEGNRLLGFTNPVWWGDWETEWNTFGEISESAGLFSIKTER
jgi:hypothetical protein